MKTAQSMDRHYLEGLRSIQSRLAGHEQTWLASRRGRAISALETLGFPTRRMEAWRYSGAEKLLEHRFKPVPVSRETQTASDADRLPARVPGTQRLTFIDGRFVPPLSDLRRLPAGVIAGSLNQAPSQYPEYLSSWLGTVAPSDRDAFVAMNSSEMNDGLFLFVPQGIEVEEPIEVVFFASGLDDSILYQPRNLLVLGQDARATLIERYIGNSSSIYFSNGLSEVRLARDATLDHIQLQQESRKAFSIRRNFVELGARSRYRSTAYQLDGGWVRSETDLRFTAEGGEASLVGLFTVGDGQVNTTHLNIDHAAPGCSSQSDFKGLLYGKGRGVFDGRILVDAQAQHTDAHLNNANLLLDRSAEVDTKPQLEIYADDVKCSHGTTVGQLEEAQLFYLCSRGIDAEQAKRLLCIGFAREIIDRCAISSIRESIEDELDLHLSGIDLSHPVQKARIT